MWVMESGNLQPAAMDGVLEVADVDDPHQDADNGDGLGKEVAELVQLPLQRRQLLHLLWMGEHAGIIG